MHGRLVLCSGRLPCALSISQGVVELGGRKEAVLRRAAGAGVECLARLGCHGVALSNVVVVDSDCARVDANSRTGPVLEMEGARLVIRGGGFVGCGNGPGPAGSHGSILAYAGAAVDVDGAFFHDVHAGGAGGAVRAAGASVRIARSNFAGCAAGGGGGGAVAAGPFRAVRAAPLVSDVVIAESR